MNRITERIAWSIAGALGIAVVALLSGVVAAGPLTPPGPPAATQETLIFQPTSCAGFPIAIGTSGSYKLAQNITNSTCPTNGIEINAYDVHLDLNGFILTGSGPALAAITSSSVAGGSEIVNGNIHGWFAGGIQLSNQPNIRVDGVDVELSGGVGIQLGFNANVSNCSSNSNGGTGIIVNQGSAVQDCRAVFNNGYGIQASGHSVSVTDCFANSNAFTGIVLLANSILERCEATFNTYDGISIGASSRASYCVASQNTLVGIAADSSGGVIEHCTSRANGLDGIRAVGGCSILANEVDGNGALAGTGIHVTAGLACRIEGNNVTNNLDSGIDIDIAGHTIFKNSASNNGAAGILDEYDDIVGGNDVGPIGTAATSTSPWANIAY